MDLTADQIDALKELINIGIGRAAGVLNTMLHSHIRLRVPVVEIFSPSALKEEMQRTEGETFSAGGGGRYQSSG
jgi:chemotaxis protein CheC